MNGMKKSVGIRTDGIQETYEFRGKEGRCAICGRWRKLVYDHDHETGLERDRICGPCNHGLGNFGDNPVVMVRAAEYIRKHADLAVHDCVDLGCEVCRRRLAREMEKMNWDE